MKLKSRIFGVSAGVMLAVSRTVAPAFAAPPVVATGEVVYPQGTQSSRGNCSTIAVGTILNPAKTAGLSLVEELLTASTKGFARDAGDVAALRVGQCSIQQRIGVNFGTPYSYLGNQWIDKNVTKFGTKLTGIADCNSSVGDVGDPDERALAGKLGISYSDFSKTDAYIRVQGFDTVSADKVWLTGIVVKGEAVGSTIGGSVWFNPAVKAKNSSFFGTPIVIDDPLTLTINEAGMTSIAVGYGTSFGFTLGEALGCSTNTPPIGALYGVPGLDLIGLGGGGYASPALGTVADGIQFLL